MPMYQHLSRNANLLLAGFSWLKSTLTGIAGVTGMPPALGVELTNHCNLKCPECPTGAGMMRRKQGYMSIELFHKIIKEIGPYLYNINLYFQGEPMMHPHFFSFLYESRNIRSVVSTNGHFLTAGNSERIAGSGLSKLIVSLDGADQEVYSAYRKNGSFETVAEGLRNISEAKRRIRSPLVIELQFLVNSRNESQIHKVRKLAEDLDVNLRLKSMQFLHKENISSWLPAKSQFRRYRSAEGEWVPRNSLPDRCARLWFNPVVTWDGNVLPCCFDKDGDYIMGNLNNESFRDIWDGPRYRTFRKSILSGRSTIDICTNCTSGMKGIKV
jgi:radical SAM protein with 4Fe4S-binding SPASM domain